MATVNLQIANGNDDVFEGATGTMNLTGSSIGLSSANQWAGLRFPGVAIPQGVVSVPTAPLQMYLPGPSAGLTLVADVYGEAADNAAAFAAGANNVSARARTAAKASVNATAAGVATWYSVEMAAAALEILIRPGWASGNAMAVVIDALTGIDWTFRAYEGNAAQAAKWDITYVIGGGLPVKVTYYAQMRGA